MTLNPSELEVVGARDGLSGSGVPEENASAPAAIVGRSLVSIAWRRLRRDRLALAGAVVILVFILVAIFAGQIEAIWLRHGQTYASTNISDPKILDATTAMPVGTFGGFSSAHPLGVTPLTGQDLLALLCFGARTSLVISALATALSLVLGISLGVVAGFYRGWIDNLISRTMDVLLSFPTLLLSLSLISVVTLVLNTQTARLGVIVFVLGFFGWPYIGRIVRGQVLSLREKEFVEAARSLGASNLRIMFREIAPNLIGPILVYTTLTIPNNILGEAGLSYLGVGVVPPTPSWGQLLSDAGNYYQIDFAYLLLPGLCIFITVLAFNLFGDGLRDALDPKSGR